MSRQKTAAVITAFIMLISVFALDVSEASAVSSSTYKIKVNTQTNVVTVYKKSGDTYKPYKAMVCSSGGKLTPTGTFRLKQKIGWCKLVGNVWGQYSTVINGNYLFHSVPYSKKAKNKIIGDEYNKLGTSCSHGCIRLSVMDAKWISDNCPQGTKVIIFRSSSKGPLGKPKPLKVKFKHGWDPTDPDSSNPSFRLPGPVIKISDKKKDTVEYGKSYSLKKYVTAKDPNTFQDLTSRLKVQSVSERKNGKWVKADSLSTKKVARYKITYKVYYKYCRQTSRMNFYVSVKDDAAPVIKTAEGSARNVICGDMNAVRGVTAKQKSCDRTSAINVTITKPGNAAEDPVVETMSYSEAKDFVFDEIGNYTIIYKVKNKYSPYREASRTVTVTSHSGDITDDGEL